MFAAKITPAYVTLNSLYLGAEAWASNMLEPGRATVLLDGDSTFLAEGKLNSKGGLSGMAKLYRRLQLSAGMELRFHIPSLNTLVVYPTPEETNATPPSTPQTVFERRNLRHLHIQPFRPENPKHWEPERETDVYLAFGVLQEFTAYQYCCGASKDLLMRLGAFDETVTKPDAILIDRATDQYLMAEWKMRSSHFSLNHKKDDVDVLVCWFHDAVDTSALPARVLSLRDVARIAAEELLDEDPT